MPKHAQRINIAKSFGMASHSYDVSSRLQRYTGKQLMSHLPNRNDLQVLDLGSGTGFFTDILASRYNRVTGLDISTKMLAFAQQKHGKAITWLAGDAYKLPLQNACLDLVYSNLMIQWCQPLEPVINEILRVLKPGGLFVFSTLADGTLHELKSSWAQVDDEKHVINFKTEQDILATFNHAQGKLLEHKVQDIVLEYENVLHLAHELKGLGANHVPKNQGKGLSGKTKWFNMMEHYQDFQEPSGIYPATYKAFSGVLVKLSD